MTEQTKRGPGRPPLKGKEQTQDIHLNVPVWIIEMIDDLKGDRNRKQFIIDAIIDKITREQNRP